LSIDLKITMMVMRFVEILYLFAIAINSQIVVIEGAGTSTVPGDVFFHSTNSLPVPSKTEVERAVSILRSAGIDIHAVCGNLQKHEDREISVFAPTYTQTQTQTQSQTQTHTHTRARRAEEEDEDEEEEGEETIVDKMFAYIGITINDEQWFYISNGILAAMCVVIAAMAAGLTMGLLSLDELDLHIKQRASDSPEEQRNAQIVMPIVRDHHRLLVTLLLLNAMANEALPLFLDKIVPGYLAVILSVTLVLFFGEIIPSAIFSGPNRLALSSRLAPLVRLCLFLLAPIAVPIAKILDYLLHDAEDDHENLQKYNRSELGALVRIQFEERMATKIYKKKEKADMGTHRDGIMGTASMEARDERLRKSSQRYVRDLDTVNLVEGALNMQAKTVQDIMTPLNEVYAIPDDMILDEDSMLEIYRRGHSRVPVYKRNTDDEGSNGGNKRTNSGLCFDGAICGVFKVKQLVVINDTDERVLSTMPTTKPFCVSPSMNMLELLNLLQTGIQMAIVCLHPEKGISALKKMLPIPNEAGVVGVVTLEDCIEELIQEEIYDEFDQMELLENKRATKVLKKWRAFVRKKKEDRGEYVDDIEKSTSTEEASCDEMSGLISYGSSVNTYNSSVYVKHSMPSIV